MNNLNQVWNQSLEQARIQSEPVVKEALTSNGLPADTTWNTAQILIDMINSIIGGLI